MNTNKAIVNKAGAITTSVVSSGITPAISGKEIFTADF